MAEQCFRMKGTTLTSIVLDVLYFDPDEFDQQLAAKVASAPQFFTRSSLIIQLSVPLNDTEFELLVTLCRQHQLQPMAVRGEVGTLKSTINDLGLSDISQSKATETALNDTADAKPAASAPPAAVQATKFIDRPVRSGQQVYAQGADLVIIAPVSEGAEVLADGNIHIYGTMRGRALAGVPGEYSGAYILPANGSRIAVHCRALCNAGNNTITVLEKTSTGLFGGGRVTGHSPWLASNVFVEER